MPSAEAPSAVRPQGASTTEISKQLTDPVSLTWSLKVKNTITFRDVTGHGDQVQYELQFQPVMPVLLTPALKLITRPEFRLVDSKPYAGEQGYLRRTTGAGDTVLDLVLSPVSDPWLVGLGPTFVFPTANLDETGQGKWQAGPDGVLGYKAKRWIAGVIVQQWWSFAGAQSRKPVSQLNLQYIAQYYFAHGWSLGSSPTIEFDWRAPPGNQVTFPIGLEIAKVVRLGGAVPVKFSLQGEYVPVHPDSNGDRFIIELTITPVIPAPLSGPQFSGS